MKANTTIGQWQSMFYQDTVRETLRHKAYPLMPGMPHADMGMPHALVPNYMICHILYSYRCNVVIIVENMESNVIQWFFSFFAYDHIFQCRK